MAGQSFPRREFPSTRIIAVALQADMNPTTVAQTLFAVALLAVNPIGAQISPLSSAQALEGEVGPGFKLVPSPKIVQPDGTQKAAVEKQSPDALFTVDEKILDAYKAN